jgi:hypothetical protein
MSLVVGDELDAAEGEDKCVTDAEAVHVTDGGVFVNVGDVAVVEAVLEVSVCVKDALGDGKRAAAGLFFVGSVMVPQVPGQLTHLPPLLNRAFRETLREDWG